MKSNFAKASLDSYYWQEIQTTPEWYSWQGYAFESVCYKHLVNIRKALKLNPRALPSTWRFVPKRDSKHSGVF